MRPDVWAPHATRVEVVLGNGTRVALTAEGDDGWFRGGPPLEPGDRYGFSLDGGPPLPDPRSRWQPDGVHGLSAVDDPSEFRWSDDGWPGLDLCGGAIYELHVGTFTPEGTLDAAAGRLPDLRDLGVAAIELLPVAEAMGARGWGYDGVGLYAVHHAYGGPAALRRFVDVAHRTGLGVLLDVVYNHLGPEGNHLPAFGPYFTERHHTPWGPAVNLDGPGSTEVRRFLIDNARQWCEEFHVDGLRLDAVHALIDERPVHVVAELVGALTELGARTGRRRWVVIEREEPDHEPLLPPERGGWGVDGRWADELHHALHAHLTGERDGYYERFGRLADIALVLERGHLPPADPLPPEVPFGALVTCAQNHDQVGNRPRGERLSHLVGPARAAAAATLVLLGPGTPLLFQGEEWAASAPFPYFCDTTDPELAARIREGRQAELAPLGFEPGSYADPLDPATAASAVLDWGERDRTPHAEVLHWYRTLLRLRREEPDLAGDDVTAVADEARGVLVVRRGACTVVVNLGAEPVVLDVPGDTVLASFGGVRPGSEDVRLDPAAAAVLRGSGHEGGAVARRRSAITAMSSSGTCPCMTEPITRPQTSEGRSARTTCRSRSNPTSIDSPRRSISPSV
jgi:maltooligosyltrehalose trehalohydrolase